METTPSSPQIEVDVPARLMAALVAAQKALRFYPPSNPQVQRTLERLKKSLERFVGRGAVRFAVSAGEVLPSATWDEWKALTGTEIL